MYISLSLAMLFLYYAAAFLYVVNVSESFILIPTDRMVIPASQNEAIGLLSHLEKINAWGKDDSALDAFDLATDRSKFLKILGTAAISLIASDKAVADDIGSDSIIVRSGKDFSYNFQPPQGFKTSNKPLKTHLDEINFTKEGERGYQYGITVDPVRINSLREFGTPEQVAERVLNAERDRDGITSVTLVGVPKEDPDSKSYEISYISEGKRGTKHFVTRIYIFRNMLYVLTAQVKVADFDEKEKEVMESVKSFTVNA